MNLNVIIHESRGWGESRHGRAGESRGGDHRPVSLPQPIARPAAPHRAHARDRRRPSPPLRAVARADNPSEIEPLKDLVKLPIGKLFRETIAEPGSFALYGYIPLMAGCSRYHLGAVNSESFCERVFSEVNNSMTSGNTLLADEELQMLALLRMNREFMAYMHSKYPHIVVPIRRRRVRPRATRRPTLTDRSTQSQCRSSTPCLTRTMRRTDRQ